MKQLPINELEIVAGGDYSEECAANCYYESATHWMSIVEAVADSGTVWQDMYFERCLSERCS